MSNQYFPGVPKIKFEGPKSKNPLAFKHYNPDELVEGKSMREHLRFAAAYWHVMRNPLADPFGGGTALMPWDDGSNSVANAQKRVRVFFEFLERSESGFDRAGQIICGFTASFRGHHEPKRAVIDVTPDIVAKPRAERFRDF